MSVAFETFLLCKENEVGAHLVPYFSLLKESVTVPSSAFNEFHSSQCSPTHCTVDAVVNVAENLLKVPLSHHFVHYNAVVHCAGQAPGTKLPLSIEEVCTSVSKYNLSRVTDASEAPPKRAYLDHAISSIKLSVLRDFNEVQMAVAGHTYVIVCMKVFSNWQPYSTITTPTTPTDKYLGNTCGIIIGYDNETKTCQVYCQPRETMQFEGMYTFDYSYMQNLALVADYCVVELAN